MKGVTIALKIDQAEKGEKSVKKIAGILQKFGAVLVCCTLLAACQAAKPETEKAAPASNAQAGDQKKTDKLVVVMEANPDSLDPQNTTETTANSAQRTMLEGLVGFDKDMKPIPVLAKEMPELGKDAKSLTIKLKEGVLFQDGTPFDGEAVKKNFERVLDKNNNLKRNNFFNMIEKVEVLDPHTVKFDLNTPFSAIVNILAHPAAAIMSPKSFEGGNKVDRHPVGTGPYQFSEWVDGQYIRMKKFDQYWDKENQPAFQTVEFRLVPETASRVAMLMAGEAHLVYPLGPEQAEMLKKNPKVEINNYPSIIENYLGFNHKQKPFDNVKVRQAINYAINKEAMINVVKMGYASIADSPVAPKVSGYSKQPAYDFSVEKAKQLLAEAGYPNGFDAILWTDNPTEMIKGAEFIKQQLGVVGINLKIETMETGTFYDRLDAGQGIQLYYSHWSPSTGQADWVLRPNFGSAFVGAKGNNSGHYINPKLDELTEKALGASDPAEVQRYYDEAQKVVVEDAAWGLLFVDGILVGKQKELKDANVLPDGVIDVRKAKF
ncbi:glutathione ABC transporter substrate-binding protein [Brevibacillus fluminis]|uniref:Glutathione-binding protein GsiB n=1 Tax=Brevibacillus fluminis TaxID=511487 RepID=A0A3M8DJB4_9BACL|nr:glutathione ABC transporter substrate-binding protein [Brevibacillus fluminis]